MAGEFKKLNPNVPTDPKEQLRGAILAVFRSWNNDRAIRYRSYNGIPDEWGTAVSVQAMAYGNMNDGCGTGVAFSRNPSTGENKFFGGERDDGRRGGGLDVLLYPTVQLALTKNVVEFLK